MMGARWERIELALPGNVTLLILREAIASVEVQQVSVMPVGLLEGLSEGDRNDLLAYLKVREVRAEDDQKDAP